MSYDALLLVSFGGPEGPDDVMPFLQNVTRGRGVPPERLAEVAEHYQHFGGVSPINAAVPGPARRVRADFAAHGSTCRSTGATATGTRCSPTPWRRCATTGSRRALAFVTSPYGVVLVVPAVPGRHRRRPGRGRPGRPGDRQAAPLPRPPRLRRAARRRGPGRPGHARPGAARPAPGWSSPRTRSRPRWTAQRRPGAAAGTRRSCARPPAWSPRRAAPELAYDLVWQSRSGPPQVPWLEPDINDHLRALADERRHRRSWSARSGSSPTTSRWSGTSTPRRRRPPQQLGLDFARAATPGTDPRFVAMVRELVDRARLDPDGARCVTPLGDAPDLGHLPGRLLRVTDTRLGPKRL